MISYANILANAIDHSGLTLLQICELVSEKQGNKPAMQYLSRLKNSKVPPAGDKLNDALAEVLNIDPLELKAAAYREKIPLEILNKICEDVRTA